MCAWPSEVGHVSGSEEGGVLSETCPYSLGHLNAWSPDGGAVWGDSGGVASNVTLRVSSLLSALCFCLKM